MGFQMQIVAMSRCEERHKGSEDSLPTGTPNADVQLVY